jgi:hypothetical protein
MLLWDVGEPYIVQTIGSQMAVCQPHAPAAVFSQKRLFISVCGTHFC